MDKKIYSDEVEAELDTYIAEGDDKPQPPSVIEEMAKRINAFMFEVGYVEHWDDADILAQELFNMTTKEMVTEEECQRRIQEAVEAEIDEYFRADNQELIFRASGG